MNSDQFRQRIRVSLANEPLQEALDGNARRRVGARVSAFGSLPDWPERRQRAHAVRADVIEHLDSYLEQFIHNAQTNGITVHRAQDAAEAVSIILKIIDDSPRKGEENQKDIRVHPRSSASRLVAKSKSMISEEIDLNHALAAAGHRAVETDLGEYIVQLRGERPSHIITPAVHLRRSDVAKLFHEQLGIPYTEDIPTLTNTARKVLREVFLTADVGLSGVNFGVAETGGICLVTNEGNGRMVTTLPRTHIALMGMERLVPSLNDLALMLTLLPRSATGQKLSVYTQLIHRPMDGQQRHLVILDNGRSRLRNSPLRESLYCIRCGSCLNACPVFRELGGHAYGAVYSGPIGSIISAGLFGSEYAPLAQASSLCGACKDACPVDIDLPKLLTRVRAGQAEKEGKKRKEGEGLAAPLKLGLQAFSLAARAPRLFAASQKLAALGTGLVSPFSAWMRLPAVTGWGYSKDFPKFAGKPFRERFVRQAAKHAKVFEARKNEETLHAAEEVLRSAQNDMNMAMRFTEELTALGGHVIPTQDATASMIEFLRARVVDRIHLEPHTLDESALLAAGITVTHEPDPAVRVGVTKALRGLADTGSVLVVDGEGHPLEASLLPEVHLVLLRASDILPSLENAIHLLKEARAAAVITGPSRTGDIEMTLTIGVHGPGEIHVFLVENR
ncbi:MAG: LUD domain-containing protein [Chloroflexi bacterium]|nr:LUD domain-containing protein [Chloroflexota bacterium]